MSQQRRKGPPRLVPSPWGLELQRMTLGGTQTFKPSTSHYERWTTTVDF